MAEEDRFNPDYTLIIPPNSQVTYKMQLAQNAVTANLPPLNFYAENYVRIQKYGKNITQVIEDYVRNMPDFMDYCPDAYYTSRTPPFIKKTVILQGDRILIIGNSFKQIQRAFLKDSYLPSQHPFINYVSGEHVTYSIDPTLKNIQIYALGTCRFLPSFEFEPIPPFVITGTILDAYFSCTSPSYPAPHQGNFPPAVSVSEGLYYHSDGDTSPGGIFNRPAVRNSDVSERYFSDSSLSDTFPSGDFSFMSYMTSWRDSFLSESPSVPPTQDEADSHPFKWEDDVHTSYAVNLELKCPYTLTGELDFHKIKGPLTLENKPPARKSNDYCIDRNYRPIPDDLWQNVIDFWDAKKINPPRKPVRPKQYVTIHEF